MAHPQRASGDDTPIPSLQDHDQEYFTKYDTITENFIENIQIVAAYDCPRQDHAVDQLCSCPRALKRVTIEKRKFLIYISFVIEWQQHILSSDAGLKFTNTEDGRHEFAKRQGLSAEEFAKAFATSAFTAPTMTAPATTLEAVIDPMLVFWDDRVAKWRKDHGSTTAIRKAQRACVPSDPDFARAYPSMTKTDPGYPPQLGKTIVFQRYRFGDDEIKHRHTVFMMPMQPELLNNGTWHIRMSFTGMKPCHESCSINKHVLTLQRLQEFAHLSFPVRRTTVFAREENESQRDFEERSCWRSANR